MEKSYLLKSKNQICPLYIPSNEQVRSSKKRCNLDLTYAEMKETLMLVWC